MELTKQQEIKAMNVYNAYWDNYLKGDVENMADLIDNEYTQIGSAVTEVFSNKNDAVKFLYDTIDQVAGKLEMRNRNIRLEQQGEFVLIHDLCDIYVLTDDKWVFYSKARASTLMQQKKEDWKFIHQHSSFPDARTSEGENIAIDKIAEENRELREAVKRRTVELEEKNRELEIETALERVRAIALSMKQPSDMVEVCKIISEQLQFFGVKDIRNVQTAIIDDHKSSYLNYQYFTEYNNSTIELAEYNKHPKAREMAETIKESANAFYSQSFDGEGLNIFRQYRKQDNQIPDPILDNATSLHFYFYSIGQGALGISTYNTPLREEELNLLRRFRNVFDLAYRRFKDIEKAVAQAREAQIEAALERVRSRSMGMQKSEELKEVIRVVYDQLVQLNIHVEHTGFIMDYKVRDDMHIWLADKHEVPFEVTFPYFDCAHWNSFIEAKEKGIDFFTNHLTFEEKNKFYQDLFKLIPGVPKETLEYYFSCPGLAISTVLLENVGLYIENFSGTTYTDEENKILMRFGKVFQQTYTRFLDLQKAEAQAREAQIEASLERIRAKAMSMHHSDELSEVLTVLFAQFDILGIRPVHAQMSLIDLENNRFTYRATGKQGKRVLAEQIIDIDAMDIWKESAEKWKRSEPNTINSLYFPKEAFPQVWELFKEIRSSIPEDARVSPEDFPDGMYITEGNCKFGYIGFAHDRKATAEEEDIVVRFATEFGRLYQRFLDLQKAEAQTREAMIEAALERVRSKSMAMHKSEELLDVITIVSQQLLHLGFKFNNVSFGINSDSYDFDFWVAAPDLDHPFRIYLPYLNSPVFNRLKNTQLNGQEFFMDSFSPKETKEWMRHLLANNDIPEFTPMTRKFLLSRTGFVRSAVLLKNIYLFLINYADIPYSDKENEIIVRFAKAFEQAYIRFLDLKKAEAQAREAKIEAALERARTQSMIMQHSSELDDTLRVFHEQVQLLGIHSAFSFLWLPDEEEGRHIFWAVWKESKNDSTAFQSKAINYPLDRNEPATAQCLVDWKSDVPIHSYAVPPGEVENYFAAWAELFAGAEKLKPEYFSSGLNYIEAFMKYGCFGVMVESKLTEDGKKILGRFSIEFERTYTRFLDLQKAEAQAREAEIELSLERVRSKAMAMHSPNDLSETVNVFFKELKSLGIIPIRCGVGQIDEATRTTSLTTTTSSQQGESFQVIGKVKQTGHPVLDGIFDHWKLQKEYHPVLEGEDIKAYYDVMNAQIGYPEYPEGVTQYGNNFFFKEGFVFAWTENKLSEEELQIFRRFNSVLSLTYRRYLDLKEAEAQSREAQIETSLERVRSRTMTMQQSDELAETAAVVFKQLINLGIEPNRIYIAILKDETGNCEFWITDEDGSKVSSGFTVNLNDNNSLKIMYDAWKEQKKHITMCMQGKELEDYFHYLTKLNIPFRGGLSQKRRMQYIAYFSKGFIGVAAPDETKPETIQLLERFAAVFNLTFTRFNDLKQAEAQNKIIQADNERKTKELEDARKLQLSMLPKEIPQLPHLDLAVYMKTATEVGGDYYDFNIDKEGTLTIVVGDATGHGMMSGMMVSIMKSFFISNQKKIELKEFFENTGNSIKDMHLGRLMMPLMGVQITSEKIIATNAGMPSLIYFRNKSQKAGEFISNNMPLGAMKGIKYLLKEIRYEKGDTLLLMSDGFAELKNENDEQYGYERVKEEFKSVAQKSPNEIVKHLEDSASKWVNGAVPDDDVTFVVIKVK